jgi:hypothetical protein
MLSPALDVIQSELEKGNLKAALEIIKTARFEGLEAPDQLTEAEDTRLKRFSARVIDASEPFLPLSAELPFRNSVPV